MNADFDLAVWVGFGWRLAGRSQVWVRFVRGWPVGSCLDCWVFVWLFGTCRFGWLGSGLFGFTFLIPSILTFRIIFLIKKIEFYLLIL